MDIARIRRIAVPLVLVAAIAAAAYYWSTASQAQAGPLTASGTIEAIEVGVASEVAGRVSEVLVETGQPVTAGQVLLRLDGRLLEVQRQNAKAAGEAAVAAAQLEQTAAQQALDDLHTNAPLAAAQAELTLAQARDELLKTQNRRTYQQPGNRATPERIAAAEANLVLAERAVDMAEDHFANFADDPVDDPQRAQAYSALDKARQARNTALATLNWYTGRPTEIDQAILDAAVAVAQANVDEATRRAEELSAGPDPQALTLAQARLNWANARLAAARAEAILTLETLDLQLEKLLIRSPLDGVVTTRHVEPGEVLLAGAEALSIGQLARPTITVYLLEDRYGQVGVGDRVRVTTDSFPGQDFRGAVARIADRAEFTPRNVQTEEGRRTTVFAVEISVEDVTGRLKPGMPADVEFLRP
jgi:HlyD family secretion protein